MNNLKAIRKKSGMTQGELADSVDLSLRFIQFLENREKNFTIETLVKISKALNCDPAEILPDLSINKNSWSQQEKEWLDSLTDVGQNMYKNMKQMINDLPGTKK